RTKLLGGAMLRNLGRAGVLVIALFSVGCPVAVVDMTGTWQGTLTNNLLGTGTITVVGVQTGNQFAAEFSAFYPGQPVITGTIAGTLSGAAISGQIIPSGNSCPGAF